MSNDLRSLIAGFQISQALYVLATLRIPDLLAEGPRTADDLADAVGSDRDALRRLLRAVAGSGVVTALDDGAFALTELGSTLRTDVPGSMHAFAAHVGRPYHWNAWAELLGSVHTGQPAFRRLHGKTAWEYRAEHPEESELFDDWMTAQTTFVDVAVLEGYDFGRFPAPRRRRRRPRGVSAGIPRAASRCARDVVRPGARRRRSRRPGDRRRELLRRGPERRGRVRPQVDNP